MGYIENSSPTLLMNFWVKLGNRTKDSMKPGREGWGPDTWTTVDTSRGSSGVNRHYYVSGQFHSWVLYLRAPVTGE